MLVIAGAALLGLAACSSSSGGGATSPVAATSSAAPTPSPTPSPTEAQRSLLSGRVGETDGPVLAVKLDNTSHSEPHAGLIAADVVYLEQVEYGITRYAAIYSTKVPKVIGPIRSARIADLELLPQYGKLAFAYSGAQHKLRPHIAAAPLYDVSGDKGPAGYWRQSGRFAPYNFFGNGKELLARAPHAQKPNDVGFTFDDEVPSGGRSLKSVTARWPSAQATFTWSKSAKRWLLTMDGRKAMSTEGPQLGGTTVIVQYVKVYDSGYGDKFGGRTPMSDTVGSGKALILRDGRAYDAAWSRPSKLKGTTWTVGGEEFPLAAGQVWVLLVNKNTKAVQSR
jgi:hypothetical protein